MAALRAVGGAAVDRALSLVLTGIVATAACTDTPMPPTRQSQAAPRPDIAAAPFSGRALDFATGTGVPAVTVGLGTVTFPSFVADAQATTDASGAFTLIVQPGSYFVAIDGVFAGSVHVAPADARGDLLARWGTCVSRYGVIADSQTRRPVAGARVTLAGQTVISGGDGWYRIDLGCPANGLVGFNTTFITVSHADYGNTCQVVGRGVFGTSRFDLFLGRRSAQIPCSLAGQLENGSRGHQSRPIPVNLASRMNTRTPIMTSRPII